MNIGQLHKYLGELIEAGTDKKLPVVLPGDHIEDLPRELKDATMIAGEYYSDPAPLMVGACRSSGNCVLLSGMAFDFDTLKDTHTLDWPRIDPPQPERN
ncbi:hypothetical protein F2S72_01510 [Pseudomonas syringae pv. actinidiae]|nr:hypothetical protein [Pseudomonas syringae pv. actinidiae]